MLARAIMAQRVCFRQSLRRFCFFFIFVGKFRLLDFGLYKSCVAPLTPLYGFFLQSFFLIVIFMHEERVKKFLELLKTLLKKLISLADLSFSRTT